MGRLMDSIMAAVGLKPSDRVDLSVVPGASNDNTRDQDNNTTHTRKLLEIDQKHNDPDKRAWPSKSLFDMEKMDEIQDSTRPYGISLFPSAPKDHNTLKPGEEDVFIKRAEEFLGKLQGSSQETKKPSQNEPILRSQPNAGKLEQTTSEQSVTEVAVTAENWHKDLPSITPREQPLGLEVKEDCLQCKVIGTTVLSGAGIYVINTVRRNQDGYTGARLLAFRLSGVCLCAGMYFK